MPKRILVVDDLRDLVRLVEINLARAGYQVEAAYDGREALQKVAAEKPDLIVLDIVMPQMNGMEVLHTLRANPETADIPIIMLTVKNQDADVFHAYRSGADLYLPKPFHPTDLLTFVNRIFESQQSKKEVRVSI